MIQRKQLVIGAAIVGVGLASSAGRAAWLTESQGFDSAAAAAAAGWAGVNNTTPPQNYGWRPSNLAAGALPGEAGGDMRNPEPPLDHFASYYADTNLGGALNLANGTIQASGKLKFTSTNNTGLGIYLAFFDPATLGGTPGPGNTGATPFARNVLGIRISDNSGNGYRMNAYLSDAAGSFSFGTFVTDLPPVLVTSFQILYTQGVSNRTLDVTFFNSDATSFTSTLIIPNSATANFTAFGLATQDFTTDSNDGTFELFIDDISYSVVPEPAGASLLALGGIAMLGGRRR